MKFNFLMQHVVFFIGDTKYYASEAVGFEWCGFCVTEFDGCHVIRH